MSLRDGDSLVSMDVLPAELADRIAAAGEASDGEAEEAARKDGPWFWWPPPVAWASGFPLISSVCSAALAWACVASFRRDGDALVGLCVMGTEEELLLVSERE